ncbi:hypothetical protein D9M71_806170 [compost metagenome]
MGIADAFERIHITRLTSVVHRHHRLSLIGDRRLDQTRIEVQGILVDIDKHWHRTS